jgi:putative transposase
VKAAKMRAYPTKGQEQRAHRMMGMHCDIYNACLEERIKAWKHSGVSVTFATQSAQLPAIRAADPQYAEYSSSAQQRTVRRVDKAYQSFFRRVKQGQTPGFPRFKARQRFNTVDHTAGDGSKWTPTQGKWARAYFKGVGHIKVSEHTPIDGEIKQLSLVRDGRKWWVIAVYEDAPNPLSETGREVAIDLGIARFLTTSDGEIVANPKFGRNATDEMADLQRRFAATRYRSKTLKRKIRKLHRKIRNQRLDFHHKEARKLVNTYDVIAHENLNIAKMSKRAKSKPGELAGTWLPNGGAAKTGLNRSITDVGWAQFLTILNDKAAKAGRTVIGVNPAYTSIRCHKCQATCTRPTQDSVVCPTHGRLDADVNGARNVALRAGLGSRCAA